MPWPAGPRRPPLPGSIMRMRMSFIARYVYTYEEFVIVTEAPQCNRMTAIGQDTDNKKE